MQPGGRLSLTAGAGGVQAVLISPDGMQRSLAPQAEGVLIAPATDSPEPTPLAFGKERYRGRLQILAAEEGRLMAINQLPLETYLASVVGSEMPASWPQPALQAQAVAARTYAMGQLRPSSPYDLKATVESQAYRGLAAETDSTRAAVASTRGEVLMAEGRLIQAVFHSSSGGSTEDSGQVWSRQLPYLVSVPDFDDDSPVSRWQLRLEPEQLRRLFRETDGVRRIEVLAKSGSGRIRRARVIGPAGVLELTGGELRQRLGLRSTLVTFQLQPVPLPAAAIAPGAAPSGSRPGERLAWSQPQAPQAAAGSIARDVRRQLRLAEPGNGAVLDSASGAVLLPAITPPPLIGGGPSGPVASDPAPAATAPATAPVWYALLVEGRGFGHGVGMSQWGAFAMARQGRTYAQILRHYYRGVELVPYPSP